MPVQSLSQKDPLEKEMATHSRIISWKIQWTECLAGYKESDMTNTQSPHTDTECMCTQSCLTLCDPMDCSLLGFSVHGIFQARVLEWVAISFSRGSF